MTTDDVHGDDMAHPELSDEQLAALLDSGSDAPAGHPVADAIMRARRELGAEPVPTPGAALSEYLGVGRGTDPIPPSAADGDLFEVGAAVEPSPRRIPVLASLSAFVGTITGKIVIGTTVAAASLSGAHAVGVVDIPGLPDIDDAAVTETFDDRQDDADIDDSDGSGSGDGDAAPADDSGSDSDAAVTTSSTTTTPPTTSSTTSTTTTTTPPTTTSTTSTTTTSTTTSTTVPSSGTITKAYTVAGVGTTTVTVTDFRISLVSAVPAAGWTLDEAGPDEDGVESTYVNGDLETSIDFEIEDGQLRVRVREENNATDERTERFEYFPLS